MSHIIVTIPVLLVVATHKRHVMDNTDILLIAIFSLMIVASAIFSFMEIRRQTMACGGKKKPGKGGKGK